MARRKPLGKKIKLIAARKQAAPRWADIKKFGLKRARFRRIVIALKNWRRGRYKV
jgi:ribosomal protein L39E